MEGTPNKEQEVVTEQQVEEVQQQEPVITNANVRALMGESYKDGLTIEEVDAFLTGKKYADLSTGNYVDKKKYDSLEKKHNAQVEALKELETLKTELNGYREKDRIQKLTKTAVEVGIDEQFIEFALSKLNPEETDTKKALKEWIKDNPQFKKEEFTYIETQPTHEGKPKPHKSMNEQINDALRRSAGKNAK